MSRVRFLLALMLTLALGGSIACEPSSGPPPRNEGPLPKGTPAGWERVGDAESQMTVVMPGGAKRVESNSGGTATISYAAKEGDTMYVVTSSGPEALQPTPDEAMHAAIGGVAKACGGEVLEEQIISKGAIGAVSFAVKCPDGTSSIGVARTTKTRLYIQLVTARTEGPPDERLKIFVSSFRPGR